MNNIKRGIKATYSKKHETIRQELKRFRDIKLKGMQNNSTINYMNKSQHSTSTTQINNEKKKNLEGLSNLLSPGMIFP